MKGLPPKAKFHALKDGSILPDITVNKFSISPTKHKPNSRSHSLDKGNQHSINIHNINQKTSLSYQLSKSGLVTPDNSVSKYRKSVKLYTNDPIQLRAPNSQIHSAKNSSKQEASIFIMPKNQNEYTFKPFDKSQEDKNRSLSKKKAKLIPPRQENLLYRSQDIFPD